MSERTDFTVDKEIVDRGEAVLACSVILNALGDVAQVACIDAYSDYRSSLPGEVAAAEQALRVLGSTRGRGDPGMGVNVSRGQVAAWEAVRAYAPWSINVDFYDDNGHRLANLHDGGYRITASLTADEADEIGRGLESIAEVLPLNVWRERDRAARRGQRGQVCRILRRRDM